MSLTSDRVQLLLPTVSENPFQLLITRHILLNRCSLQSGDSYDQNGKLLVKNQLSTFIVGAGNFGGKSNGSSDVVPSIPVPNRAFDSSVKYVTSVDQAALYRLSGDANPLHIDPDFAKIAGHKTPIMHGLCTLGFSLRAVLSTYAGNDVSLFKAIKVRFTKPAIPGQTLEIQMWQNGNRIHFQTKIVDTGVLVITGTKDYLC